MIRKQKFWGAEEYVCNNDRKKGTGNDDYYEIKWEVCEREFPDFKFTIDLSECYAEQLDDPLPYKTIYFEDRRLENEVKIPFNNPTRRQVIQTLNEIYTNEILEDHKFLESFRIQYDSDHMCVLTANWDS